ncbi:hypothetical protein C0584_02255 [Candidatus Parcubacteria bacterium]|nr:MAG: hypothetical protein C0584_02255 [Candidatus Parcubacteria bacterium]
MGIISKVWDMFKEIFSAIFGNIHIVQAVAESVPEPKTGILSILFGVLGLIVFFILSLYLLKALAKLDIFVTTVCEGQAKAIMGAGGGGFRRIIFQYSKHSINNEGDITRGETSPVISGWKRSKDWLSNKLGLSGIKFVGLPFLHTIHEYNFKWNSLKQTDNEEGVKDAGGIYYKPHAEDIKYILLQPDVYYARIQEAEDKNMVPLDLDLTVQCQVVNPQKALFDVQEWLEMVWGLVLPAIRRYVAKSDWEVLAKKTDQESETFKDALQVDLDNIKNRFGIHVSSFQILRVKPGGSRATMYEEAATKLFEAKAEAKSIKELAKAEQFRIRKEYGTIKEYDELGQLIRRLEALEKAAEQESNTIISMPELMNISSIISKIAA